MGADELKGAATKPAAMMGAVENARENYVAFYRRAAAEARAAHPDCVAELMVLANGPPSVPELYRLIRLDLAWREGGEFRITKVESNPITDHTPLETSDVDGVDVQGYRIRWDHCTFVLEHPNPSWATFERWFERWVDRAEQQEADADDLSGVVHAVMQPASSGLQHSLSVDFGSAPITAFHELIRVFHGMGVTRVRLESRD